MNRNFRFSIISFFGIISFFFAVTAIYLYPMFQGLVLLPLDLLIARYHPWMSAGTILLKNPYMQDSIVQMFPWKLFTFQMLREGILPLWNPYQFMGMPFMASLKPTVFYPFTILYYFFDIVNAWNILLFSQILLSLIFSYFLAKEFKLSFFARIIVAFSFSFSSLMIGVLEFGSEGHVLLWTPLMLYATKRILNTISIRHTVFLVGSIALSILAGHLQYFVYQLMIIAGFIMWHFFVKKWVDKTKLIILILSIVIGIGLSGIQLLPSFELFSYSVRGQQNSYNIFTQGLLAPYHLLRLVSPDYFGNPITQNDTIGYIEQSGYFGILPLFFALVALIKVKNNIAASFFKIAFITGILLSLNGIAQIFYVFHIPVITSGAGLRIFFITLFSGSMLAGFGFDNFMAHERKLYIWGKFLILFLLIIVLTFIFKVVGIQHSILHFDTALKNLKFPSINVAVFTSLLLINSFIKTKHYFVKTFLIILTLVIIYMDFFRFGYRFLTFSNRKFLYPQIPLIDFLQEHSANMERFYGPISDEFPTISHIYGIETYNPLYVARSAKFVNELLGKSASEFPINKYALTNSDGLKLKKTLDLLGVSFFVTNRYSNPSNELFNGLETVGVFPRIHEDSTYAVFENVDAQPRFALYYDYDIRSEKEIVKSLSDEHFDARKQILLEHQISFEKNEGTGSAKLMSNTVNAMEFAINTTAPALFYLSDTYFPGWKAEINGLSVPIYRANYNFRSVIVPAGASKLTMRYQPKSFQNGLVLSIASVCGFIGLSVYIWIRKKKSF